MEILDPKSKKFNLVAALCIAVFIGSWSMVKNVESKIADVAKREIVDIEREIQILKLKMDSLDSKDDGAKAREIKEYCKENVSRLERRLEYVERHSVNPFRRK